jgi:hypothetical protein
MKCRWNITASAIDRFNAHLLPASLKKVSQRDLKIVVRGRKNRLLPRFRGCLAPWCESHIYGSNLTLLAVIC